MITIRCPKRLVEVGLYNVAARSPRNLPPWYDKLRDRVKYAAEKVRLSGTKIVMLTGPSASGKTTSAHKLAEELIRQGTYAHVVSLDNFFRGARLPTTAPWITKTQYHGSAPSAAGSTPHELERRAGPPCPMILPTSGAPTRPRPWTCRAVVMSASWRGSMP